MKATSTPSSQGVIGWFMSSYFPPMLILLALVLGAVSLWLTPREEDPQIVVPMADVLIEAPGLSARQVATQVTEPLERLLSQIDGVEYVYSQSMTGQALVIVRFYVGEDREDSLVKLYNKLYSNQDQIPAVVHNWSVKPVEIDDVPILVAALYSTDPTIDHFQLRRLAEQATQKLKAIRHTNQVSVSGGLSRLIQIELDNEALAAHHTSVQDVERAIRVSNQRQQAGTLQRDNRSIALQSGDFLRSASEVGQTVVNVLNGQPVYLRDIATITDGPAEPSQYSFFYPGAAFSEAVLSQHQGLPAVFLAVGKQKGANAVWVANDVLQAFTELEQHWLPAGVKLEVIRNYGETADEKVMDLVSSLAIAIITVVIFVGLFLNWRAALVVAIAIPISYGATLGMDLLFGYTINRVTLFALILALGLIVDDPIASIDNIERFLREKGLPPKRSIVLAMAEIRSALLMSTLAIVIVFTPMFFITGMMGPYMAPMAFNVPISVIFSTAVAFLITPWLARRIMVGARQQGHYQPQSTLLYRGYKTLLGPLLQSPKRSSLFLWAVAGLFVLAAALPAMRLVPLKLLPNDNKNEFQLVVDLPYGSSVERTAATLEQLARHLQQVPEISSISSFAGLASPMDFNGMVRHYFLRHQPHQGELRVVLVDKKQRRLQSHEILLRLRDELEAIAHSNNAKLKLVQVPPGPPVISTLVAEIYGSDSSDYMALEQAALTVAERLRREDFVREVDTSVPEEAMLWRFVVDQEKAALSGVSVQQINQTLAAAASGLVIDYLQLPDEVNPLPIEIRLPRGQRDNPQRLLSLYVRGEAGLSRTRKAQGVADAALPMVQLSELGHFEQLAVDRPIFHKNLRPVSYVYGETVGRVPADAVVDVMVDRGREVDSYRPLWRRHYFGNGAGLGWSVPDDIQVVWSGEGEWKITLDVFRDLGIAYGVALLGVFVVMVLQTGLKAVSGMMMLAIPLTIIGIMPGFWLLNLFSSDIAGYPNPTLFTATAMIGMIALAGIVVRNSLILIEFIQQRLREGCELKEALFEAGAVRTRPILLTAGTTMLANIVITLDPIFNGLAWAIIFGIGASTIFTLLVIPVVYHQVYRNHPSHGLKTAGDDE